MGRSGQREGVLKCYHQGTLEGSVDLSRPDDHLSESRRRRPCGHAAGRQTAGRTAVARRAPEVRSVARRFPVCRCSMASSAAARPAEERCRMDCTGTPGLGRERGAVDDVGLVRLSRCPTQHTRLVTPRRARDQREWSTLHIRRGDGPRNIENFSLKKKKMGKTAVVAVVGT